MPISSPSEYALASALHSPGDAAQIVNKVNKPSSKYTTIATDTTIAGDAAALSGADHVFYRTTAAGAGGIALTVPTAAALFAAMAGAFVGMTYILTIISQGGGTVTVTADGGATVTIAGTATIATKTTRTFLCTFTSATAMTMQSLNKGTIE